MKNKKMNLSELKVKSFVTDLENGKENTVKGGIGLGASDNCHSKVYSECCTFEGTGPCDNDTDFGKGCVKL